VRRWAGTSCSPRAVPGGPPEPGGQHAGGPYRPGDAVVVPPRPHWHSGRNAGRHESSKVRAVVTTTRRSPLIRWPPQLAASQISAAARIATNNTTTMTAAGIARSLRSCLCTSVPLAVDDAGHGAAGKPGAAALAASGTPGSACSCRTYACPIRRCAPSPLAAARAAPVGADRRGTRPGALTGIARMPGPDVALGSVAGRRRQPPRKARQ
jgi:hypothetical protein